MYLLKRFIKVLQMQVQPQYKRLFRKYEHAILELTLCHGTIEFAYELNFMAVNHIKQTLVWISLFINSPVRLNITAQ